MEEGDEMKRGVGQREDNSSGGRSVRTAGL
jgi:hypothetical protein